MASYTLLWCIEPNISAVQVKCHALERQLEQTHHDLDHSRRKEYHAESTVTDIHAQLAAAQSTVHEMTMTWLKPEKANQLCHDMKEWKAKHDRIEQRYGSLADDFQHLSDRKSIVEAERVRQRQNSDRAAALHAGVKNVLHGVADLEERCCNVLSTAPSPATRCGLV